MSNIAEISDNIEQPATSKSFSYSIDEISDTKTCIPADDFGAINGPPLDSQNRVIDINSLSVGSYQHSIDK